jgi:hypothetical protein
MGPDRPGSAGAHRSASRAGDRRDGRGADRGQEAPAGSRVTVGWDLEFARANVGHGRHEPGGLPGSVADGGGPASLDEACEW